MSMDDVLEDTWFYQHILQKGLVRGQQQGLEQGLEQGKQEGLEQGVQALRTTLTRFVETHFPDQLALAQRQVEFIATPSQVQELLDKLFVARTTDEVRNVLLAIPHA
jgi:predicted transposase YdaD